MNVKKVKTSRSPVVLFVEDETYLLDEFAKILRREGYDVITSDNPDDALARARESKRVDLLLTDIQMSLSPDTEFSQIEASGGQRAGLALANAFRQLYPTSPIILWSHKYLPEARDVILNLGNARLISKRQDGQAVLDEMAAMLAGIKTGERPRIFIVHGHDDILLEKVRSLIAEDFGLPDPVVLREQATKGKTLIEGFETEAINIDLVLVLLTPDDKAFSNDERNIVGRARQNVIFELGFFMGLLGRAHGRIILLKKGDIEMPSDMHGLLTIDVTKGLDRARKEIARGLREWLPQ